MLKRQVPAPVSGVVKQLSCGKDQEVEEDTTLCIITDTEGQETKVKCLKAGKVLEIRKSAGDRIEKGRTLFLIGNACGHLQTFNGICVGCGFVMPKDNDRKMVTTSHRTRGLRKDITIALEDANTHKQDLLNGKKLIMLLDLDQTVIHATCSRAVRDSELIPAAMRQSDTLKGQIHQFQASRETFWVGVRPGALEFIANMSKLFEINVYTAADRPYADEIVKIVDPEGKYIGSRVLTRTESPDVHRKFVERLFPFSAELVVIVDDSIRAWYNDKGQYHLYKIPPFVFFTKFPKPAQNLEKPKTPAVDEEEDEESEESSDLSDSSETTPMEIDEEQTENKSAASEIPPWISTKAHRDDELRFCGSALTRAHTDFFQQTPQTSMNHILNKVRMKVLVGVHILFSSIVPKDIEKSPFWHIATAFGAICHANKNEKISHVICAQKNTDKFNWANAEQKRVVHISWLVQVVRHWERPPESAYSLERMGNCPKEHLDIISREFSDSLHCYPVVDKEVTKDDLLALFDDTDTSEESSTSGDAESSPSDEPPQKKRKTQ